jgi:hypothetical protein
MTDPERRRLPATGRFHWPDDFFLVTAAYDGVGLVALGLSQLFEYIAWAGVFGLIGILLVLLTIPHPLPGLYLLLPLRHFVHSVLAGLVIAAIIINVFIAIQSQRTS